MQLEFTKEEIANAAQQVWEWGKTHRVWAFYATMGGGKTTFISTLCRAVLSVEENISSPTFAIINQYQSPVVGAICHMDWYRLKSEEEAIQAGVEDAIMQADLCLIEWPEIAPALLPEDCLHICLEIAANNTRIIKMEQNLL